MFTANPYVLESGDPIELMQKIPDDFVDLVVTNPSASQNRIKKTVSNFYRILKPGAVAVWIAGDADHRCETGNTFQQALTFLDEGFLLHDTMIWRRLTKATSKLRYHPSFEYMFVFSKQSPITINLIKDRPISADEFAVRENIWYYDNEQTKTVPVPLVMDHITSWSKDGDTVLDPFMSYGSVGLASMLLNRKFIGFERNKDYFKLAEKRIINWKTENINNFAYFSDDLYDSWETDGDENNS